MKSQSRFWTSVFVLATAFHATGAAMAGPQWNPVNPPNFYQPNIGFYCSYVYPTAGWELKVSAAGDVNTNMCAGPTGTTVRSVGLYSVNGPNAVDVWCNPTQSAADHWFFSGTGVAPINQAFAKASAAHSKGDCTFRVTIGGKPRTFPEAAPTVPQLYPTVPGPDAQPGALDVGAFTSSVVASLETAAPKPVGYQLAVRDPHGKLVYSKASGSVTGTSDGLPYVGMTTSRRFDVASISKTFTAIAAMAAFEDFAKYPAPTAKGHAPTLDSPIAPYLPSNWTVHHSVQGITFRDVITHTAGFCNGPTGDDYASVQAMIAAGTDSSWVGHFHYCDSGYALMRILLAYVIDGRAAYADSETNLNSNAARTALSYRNFIRGRVLAPIGLAGVDDYYTGPLPETMYFTSKHAPIPDQVNIPGTGYDETADTMVLHAGSGNWTISAEEMTHLIQSLWAGQIVSAATVAEMLPRLNPNANLAGTSIYGSDSLFSLSGHVFHNEGGGGLGGPQTTWTTLQNGYTVALFLNTEWGTTYTGSDLMQVSAAPVPVCSGTNCPPVVTAVTQTVDAIVASGATTLSVRGYTPSSVDLKSTTLSYQSADGQTTVPCAMNYTWQSGVIWTLGCNAQFSTSLPRGPYTPWLVIVDKKSGRRAFKFEHLPTVDLR